MKSNLSVKKHRKKQLSIFVSIAKDKGEVLGTRLAITEAFSREKSRQDSTLPSALRAYRQDVAEEFLIPTG